MSARAQLALAGLMLVVDVGSAAAERGRHRDWEAIVDDGACVVTERVTARADGTLLLEVSLIPAGDGDGPAVLVVRVPTGAHLASGIAYRRPGRAPRALVWQACDVDLCAATLPLDRGEFDGLLGERVIEIAWRPLGGVRPLDVPVSLDGARAAWAAITACPTVAK